jgi:hypothetical protein
LCLALSSSLAMIRSPQAQSVLRQNPEQSFELRPPRRVPLEKHRWIEPWRVDCRHPCLPLRREKRLRFLTSQRSFEAGSMLASRLSSNELQVCSRLWWEVKRRRECSHGDMAGTSCGQSRCTRTISLGEWRHLVPAPRSIPAVGREGRTARSPLLAWVSVSRHGTRVGVEHRSLLGGMVLRTDF